MGVRVLIADDHPIWRRGLREILEPTFTVVSEASEGGEAVDKALACRPDVVVMDISMPGMDGIAATRQIKEAQPETAVIIVSATDDQSQICESIAAGVSGYVVKDDVGDAIIEAVRHAANGSAYLPPPIAKRVLGVVGARNAAGFAVQSKIPLSDRELAVLKLMAQGLRHKEIARELRISQRTVGNHVASIYNKLGISDRAQAIVYAVKKGIVRI